MTAAGIEKQTVNGLRVTSPEALAIVRRVFQAAEPQAGRGAAGQRRARDLDRLAACSRPTSSTATPTGWSARSSACNLAPIEAACKAGSIPVIATLGETAGGQILNVNADFAANELVKTLQPYKIVFLTGTGGLLDDNGKVIDSINLSTEYEHLMRSRGSTAACG